MSDTADRNAPPAPPCFPVRLQWVRFLDDSQRNKWAAGRPFDAEGNYRPAFNFCSDCTTEHRAEMLRIGSCKPHTFKERVA